MKADSALDVQQLMTDLILQQQGLNTHVKDFIAALEFRDKQKRAWTSNTRGPVQEVLVFPHPVKLKSLVVYNAGVQQDFVQLHDQTGIPMDGSMTMTPPLPIGAGQLETFDFADGLRFSTGLYICGSSTDSKKTLIAGKDLFILWNVEYD